MPAKTNPAGNPANVHTRDLVAILGKSPFMSKAMADCPDDEWQQVEDSFNQLMWQMIEATIEQVQEATRRRALREIQVGDKVWIAKGPRVEIKEGTHPRIFEENGIPKAEVETPTGKVMVEFEEKK